MGIAKKIDLLAYAIAQGMTQGTLPLIGYNFTSGDHKRMKAAIKAAFAYSFLVACAGAVLLWTLAAPISRCFIADAETVRYGQRFLKIISGNAAVCRHPQDSVIGFHAFSDRYGRFDYPHHSRRGYNSLFHCLTPFV